MFWHKYILHTVIYSDMAPSNGSPSQDTNRVEVRALGDDSESVIQTTLRILAEMRGVPVGDLEPLYEQVETDAVVNLLTHAKEFDSAVCVEFTVEEYTVAVSHDNRDCPRDTTPVVVEVVDTA